MGLFSKKPTRADAYTIQTSVSQVKILYSSLFSANKIDLFISEREELNIEIERLLKYEKKYPNVFYKNQRPSDILRKIQNERAVCERKLIDRNLALIESTLLNYKTERGKRNNFIKETDIIKYYAEELLPETVEYFELQLQKMFPQYI